MVCIIIMDMGQKIAHPLLRINIRQFAAAHKGVVNGCILSDVMIAAEKITFLPYGYRTYTVFDEIIIDATSAIKYIADSLTVMLLLQFQSERIIMIPQSDFERPSVISSTSNRMSIP